eukprot:m.112012 g.112012  ORF g.112012 m.112012 type:complete len:94 (-) comp17022_c0_seq2:893-1174(-)
MVRLVKTLAAFGITQISYDRSTILNRNPFVDKVWVMKVASVLLAISAIAAPSVVAAQQTSIFNFSSVPINGGDPVPLSVYSGNVTMVVNVATY